MNPNYDEPHPRTPFPADLVPGSHAYYAEALRRKRLASAEGFYDDDAESRVAEEDQRERDELAFLVAYRRETLAHDFK